ncbi:MAG TPA: SDR family oxidoreductase [Roseomonas sp.]|jgi:uncharacterized protein YbjT (DUF2867 family)
MRVLLLGAGGFIGTRIAAALRARGHAVLGCGRGAAVPADLTRDGKAQWLPRLAGIDAVVNAAGALDGPLEAIHASGPIALFEACAEAGIPRLVQISALGAGEGTTRFLRTKRQADAALLALRAAGGRDGWCVLRPSLVVGRGGASTRRFAALAALPRPVRLGPGGWRLQPLHVDDLAALVAARLEAAGPVPACDELGGPAVMDTDGLTALMRGWLGLPPRPPVALPLPLLRLAAAAGRLIPGSALRPDSLAMLAAGNVASAAPPPDWRPRPLAEAMAAEPAGPADRLDARLLPLRPAMRLLLAAVWIGSTLVSLTVGWTQGLALLARVGLTGWLAQAVVVGGALADLLLGLLLFAPRHQALIGGLQVAVILGFSTLAGIVTPEAWADPYGPLLKDAAMLAATLGLAAMREGR